MSENCAKPKLLFFAGPFDYLGNRILLNYVSPLERLLCADFRLQIVSGSCDFSEEVQRHEPDMVLFHGGVESPNEPRKVIANTDCHHGIPRAGILFTDPWSFNRYNFLRRLREWHVEDVFSIVHPGSCRMGWDDEFIFFPWWIDDTVYRDYGEEKILPISMTGGGWLGEGPYPWRRELTRKLIDHYPVYFSPVGSTHRSFRIVGEAYARLLNRSVFSAGCGTVYRLLTRKILEIPACRSCLITQPSPVFGEYGFCDMVNCVMTEPDDALDKVEFLFRNPDVLQRITDAGYELVHSEHLASNRRQFADWFQLKQRLKPGQRIVQPTLCGPLSVYDPSDGGCPPRHFVADNPAREAFFAGFRHLERLELAAAERAFVKANELMDSMAEPCLGYVLVHLMLDNLEDANNGAELRRNNYRYFNHAHMDPCDRAALSILALRRGEVKDAFKLLAGDAALRHPFLNATRHWFTLNQPDYARKHPEGAARVPDMSANTHTLMPVGDRSWSEWMAFVNRLARPGGVPSVGYAGCREGDLAQAKPVSIDDIDRHFAGA